MTVQHVKTTRWYPDGSLAYEFRGGLATEKTYYAPNGDRVTDYNIWAETYGNLILESTEDDRVRPYGRLLTWWNE